MKVYIVFGETGEYDDHEVYDVAVYEDEELAKQHAGLANKVSRRLYEKYHNIRYRERAGKIKNKYDPEMREVIYPTEYSYFEMEVLQEILCVEEA